MWNQDERKGKVDQVKGKVKQAVGALTNHPDLKAEGQIDEVKGIARQAVGQVRRTVGGAIDRATKVVKR